MDPQALATALEASSLGAWVRDGWNYPIVNTLHLVGLALLVGPIVLLDLRLLGYGKAFAPDAVSAALTPIAVAGGVLMVWGLYLGAYHSGVEWGWWAGPADCGVVVPTDTGGRSALDALDAFVPPACDQAAGRFLGLSFAGWNVVASAILAALAFRFAFAREQA